ncbi:MAG: flagellar motor switch protein FliN [Dehalococcoidia bacterium]
MQEEMHNSLGQYAEALAELAVAVREQALTGIESLTGTRPMLSDISFGPVDAAGVEAEFADTPHVSLEMRLRVPDAPEQVGVLLVPLMDLGGLLGIETGEERMADADFAAAQLQVVAGATREFFDLLAVTLFVDALAGVEIVPGDARFGDGGAVLASVGGSGSSIVRIDVGLALPDGQPVRVILLLPQQFLDALGQASTDTRVPTSGAAPLHSLPPMAQSEPIGLDADLDNILSFRSAAMFGAPTVDDAEAHPVRFPPLSEPARRPSERQSLDLIMDVSMRVTVELGRSTLTVEEVLSLGPGSVVELNKLAGEPVDVLVNEQLIARGEVVVVDENFGVRVTEIVSPRRRAQAMGA